MATKQGMCRNCGSLIMFDDRDQECECIFCHCVFPSAEAVEIFENPEGREFANETFEARKDSKVKYPTAPSIVESAVARDKISQQNKSDNTIKPNEFEVSPSDIKMPAKTLSLIIGIVAIIAIVVILVSLPMYKSRTALKNDIVAKIDTVFDGVAEVDTTLNDKGYANGYHIFGQKCDKIKVALKDDIDEKTAEQLFVNYAELRNEVDGKGSSSVTMELYTPSGIYTVEGSVTNSVGAPEVVFTADGEED